MAVLDDLPWDEVIAPSPFATIKNVPTHVQGQVLDTMRQILQHVNDAAVGPNADELEFERWSKLYFQFPAFFLRIPPRGGRRGANMVESRLEAYRRRDFTSLLKWYRHDQEAARQARPWLHADECGAHRTKLRGPARDFWITPYLRPNPAIEA